MRLQFNHKNISLIAWLLTLNLAVGWLLPNHYQPWLAFHANAWVALALLLIFLRNAILSKRSVDLKFDSLFLLSFSLFPLIQYVFGIMPLPSDALLGFLSLLGAAIAYILAQHWNKTQPLGAAACVLAAMTMAAVASTGIATFQWLGLAQDFGLMDIWMLPFADGTRPYANMAQPNQLASLLLCGLLGVAWAWHKRHIGNTVAMIAATWILWGISLTESRTALLTFGLTVTFLTFIRPRYLSTPEIRSVQILFVFYLACLLGKASVATALGLEMPLSVFERSAGELRFSLWKMSLEASLQSPWFGFGLGRSNAGYFLVFDRFKEILGNTYFEQSHNLFLDLALWIGWPLAIMCIIFGGIWFAKAAKKINSPDNLIVFMALFVLLTHAMFEFPLYYGYFLWPFFTLAGSLSGNLKLFSPTSLKIPSLFAISTITGLLVISIVIVSDYIKIEDAFRELRFQTSRIGSAHDETPPKTLLLTDWPDAIALARATPRPGMPEDEIRHWESLLMYHTSPLALRKVIGANMLNGREEEAKAWARRSCWLLSEKICGGLVNEWNTPTAPPPPASQPK